MANYYLFYVKIAIWKWFVQYFSSYLHEKYWFLLKFCLKPIKGFNTSTNWGEKTIFSCQWLENKYSIVIFALKVSGITWFDLEWVSWSCPRIRGVSFCSTWVSLSRQYGFNSYIYQQVIYKNSSRAPSASVPIDRLPDNLFGKCFPWVAGSMPLKSQKYSHIFYDYIQFYMNLNQYCI